MQIIVVGCGKVGRSIISQLTQEDNNVTVIDINPTIIRNISTNYDVMGIVGNGSSFNILAKATWNIRTCSLPSPKATR